MKTTLSLYLLLSAVPLIAMKRHHTEASTKQQDTTAPQESFSLIDIPQDILNSTLFFSADTHTIMQLKKTCTFFNTSWNRTFFMQSPAHIEHLCSYNSKDFCSYTSKDFCCYTNLLYHCAEKNNQETFDFLWENQSRNDRRIRNAFVKDITPQQYDKEVDEKTRLTFTTLRCFDKKFMELLPNEAKKVITKKYYAHFVQSLRNNQPHIAHLVLSGPFTASHINKNIEAYALGNTFPLYYACLHPTTTFLTLLLKHGVDTTVMLHYKANILHWLLDHENPIDQLSEKIALILKTYKKQCPNETTLLNQITQAYNKTDLPLQCLFSRFNADKISLDEFLTIMTLLLQHGADPSIKTSTQFDNSFIHWIKQDPDHEVISAHMQRALADKK